MHVQITRFMVGAILLETSSLAPHGQVVTLLDRYTANADGLGSWLIAYKGTHEIRTAEMNAVKLTH